MNPNNLPLDMQISTWPELCILLGGSPDSFTGQLLDLFAKADQFNKARLARSFPHEMCAWALWMEGRKGMTVGKYLDHVAGAVKAGRTWYGHMVIDFRGGWHAQPGFSDLAQLADESED